MSGRFEQLVAESGVVAIMRASSSAQLLDAAEALVVGGVHVVEVTMTTPGALEVISAAVKRFGGAVSFGAGSVLDSETARAAILAGAQFVVAPTVDVASIELCRRYDIPILPGAFTATEVLTAWQAGAHAVKVFPASIGGPDLIRALRGPLPKVRLCAVGGITVENTADFIRAGVESVGVGGELVNNALLESRDFATITDRARRFREEVARGRQG